jgi:hypothetical protein
MDCNAAKQLSHMLSNGSRGWVFSKLGRTVLVVPVSCDGPPSPEPKPSEVPLPRTMFLHSDALSQHDITMFFVLLLGPRSLPFFEPLYDAEAMPTTRCWRIANEMHITPWSCFPWGDDPPLRGSLTS